MSLPERRASRVLVAAWARDSKYDGNIAYFFESGDKHQGEADRMMREAVKDPKQRVAIHYASHSFVLKGKTRALEAADMLAWNLNRYYNDTIRAGEVSDQYMPPILPHFFKGGRATQYSLQSLRGDDLKRWFKSAAGDSTD